MAFWENASHVAHHRLDYEARDLSSELLKSLFHRLLAVERKRQGKLRQLFEHPSRAGNAQRCYARTSLDQERIGVSVIAAFKLDDVFTIGKGARQPDGRHGSFCPGTDKADLLHPRKGIDNCLGQLGFRRRTCAKAGAIAIGFFYCLHDLRMSMTKDQRPPGADIVKILVAIGVPDARSLAAHDVRRIACHGLEGAYRRVHASRNHLGGAGVELARFVVTGHRRQYSSTARK